jgi:protoheme IX farnesyltransferase
VSLATVLVYLLLYTPLKPVTPQATLIGAVPGALPPLIGYSAAAGSAASLVEPGALALFAIMFIWQIPHFLAIAWIYRDDYAKGGYRVLPVVDRGGGRTARAMLLWAGLLIPAALAPAWTMKPVAAAVYGVLAAAMGLAYFWLTLRVARTRERADARRAFIASVIHLPLLLVLIVACAGLSRLL